jgi:hypothetical protein
MSGSTNDIKEGTKRKTTSRKLAHRRKPTVQQQTLEKLLSTQNMLEGAQQ